MSGKSHSVVVLCSTGEVFSGSDEDEDLDLTDTKLLSSGEEKLKEYIEMTDQDNAERTVPKDSNYVDSLSFKPLTSASSSSNISSSVVHKDSAIVLSDDEVGGVLHSHLEDLPDYESPAEEEVTDIKYTLLGKMGKVKPNNVDELPDKYNQDKDDGIVDDDDIVGYDCFDEVDFNASSPCKSKVEKFSIARVAPYSIKDRHTYEKGKGKQPVCGPRKYKSSKKNSSPISDSPKKDLICSDFGTPVCFEDDIVNTSLHLEREEQPMILSEPLVCESCSKEEGHNSMVQCCDGHVVCTKCVEASAKKVLVGERKGSIECPQLECNSSVPMSELRKALPAIVLDLLEDKWNKETLEALENMKDVVKCPGCSFSAVLDISLKRFQCIQCNEAYCRYCEYKWNDRKTHELCVPTKQWTSTVTGNVVNIPARWSETSGDASGNGTEGHIVVNLDTDSEEFLDVVHTMNKHMEVNVKKIYRVQNERLWEKYSLTRSHMVADLGELNINEQRLFHGTHRDVIEAICREGFDWRLCGKHGVVYGQGTYFAKSSVLSHHYSSGYSSSKKGKKGFLGGLLFGALGQRPPSTIPSSVFRQQGTAPGFTFGGTPRSTSSFGFTFGVPSTTASSTPHHLNSSGAGAASGGPAGGYNPVFQFGSTAASFSSGSDTNNKNVCPAHSKSKGTGACGHGSSTITFLPAPAGIYTKSESSMAVSSTTDDVNSSPYKRECQNCIFCTHKKKPNVKDPGKKGLDPTKYVFSIQKSSPMQHSGSGAPVVGSGSGTPVFGLGSTSAASGSGSASSGSGNADSTTDEATLKQQQHEEVRNLIRNMFRNNTGAHLFMGSVSPSSGFVFPSRGSKGKRKNNSNASGGNGSNNGDDDSNDCYMFLARVLLGRSCLGTSNMRRPARNREGLETHSAVDQEQDPGVFVIFDNNQCYPEYIIQYSK